MKTCDFLDLRWTTSDWIANVVVWPNVPLRQYRVLNSLVHDDEDDEDDINEDGDKEEDEDDDDDDDGKHS